MQERPELHRSAFRIIGLITVMLLMLVFSCAITAAAETVTPDADTWQALQEAVDNAAPGDTLVLTADVTAGGDDKALTIPCGAEVTLDLNGHTVDRNLSEDGGSEGVAVFIQHEAMLTVKDSSQASSGKITGGYSSDGGGIHNIGTLMIEGGCITGNRTSDAGGGIVNYSLLVIKGGAVTGNSADTEGGGIFNGQKGRMTLGKNTVFGNNAPKDANISNIGMMTTVGEETVFYTALSSYMDMLAVLPVLVLLTVLFLAVTLDSYLDKPRKKVLYIIMTAMIILVLQNYLEYRLSGDLVMPRTLLAVLGYSLRPAILALFLHLIDPERNYRLVWTAVGINAALYSTAFFSPLTFYFSDRHFHAGVLNNTCLILSAVLFAYCLYLTFIVFRPRQRKESWIPVFALVMIGAAVAMDYTVVYHYQPVSFLTIAIAISSIMFYIWLHLQFVREHERALQAEHRIQIMMTQIQPHFLFNTLTAIRALCVKDRDAAVRTIGLFSAYLRQNIESLNQSELIPLSKELEHTRIYTEIEMIRFPNIRIEYDIEDEEFGVPALTVQPLVENSIRHGVRSREEGIVTVRTYSEAGEHIIVIEDNGIGFDVQAADNSDGTHIGISNVRERLERMCGGSMEIDSKPDEGTRITLRIPAAKGAEQDR